MKLALRDCLVVIATRSGLRSAPVCAPPKHAEPSQIPCNAGAIHRRPSSRNPARKGKIDRRLMAIAGETGQPPDANCPIRSGYFR